MRIQLGRVCHDCVQIHQPLLLRIGWALHVERWFGKANQIVVKKVHLGRYWRGLVNVVSNAIFRSTASRIWIIRRIGSLSSENLLWKRSRIVIWRSEASISEYWILRVRRRVNVLQIGLDGEWLVNARFYDSISARQNLGIGSASSLAYRTSHWLVHDKRILSYVPLRRFLSLVISAFFGGHVNASVNSRPILIPRHQHVLGDDLTPLCVFCWKRYSIWTLIDVVLGESTRSRVIFAVSVVVRNVRPPIFWDLHITPVSASWNRPCPTDLLNELLRKIGANSFNWPRSAIQSLTFATHQSI